METVGSRSIPTAAEWRQHLAGPDTICTTMYQLIDDLATLIPTAGTVGIDISTAIATAITVSATTTTASILISGGHATGLSVTGTPTVAAISVGTAATALAFGTTSALNGIRVNSSSSSTSGSTSVRYIYGTHAATGAAGVGHRAEFHTTATAKLGGWANALKGYFECGASGDITGLLSGVCAEVKLPNANTSGTVCVMELELVTQTSSGVGTLTSLIYSNITGAGAATIQTSGYLWYLDGMGTAGAGKMFDTCTAAAASHALKIRIDETDYYIMLQDNVDA